MLETNIDDCSAEVLGYVMEKLMDYALDVFYTPIFMKKNRPAYKLSVLCYEKYEKQVESIIFKKNFLSYQLVISGENFELKCRVNKITIASSWHKKGLANILEQYN